ncbi:hypothetical protein KL86PLE_40587 [uncultured Pleomorphomonas sp.]|uniref:Uncharacterized protein n=1 Tax=uncultured Pleomorphomonas sp. TaxID=442121 RepID=A0A212LGV5_9HYPH|nr:hypothetical protein KL86PLE_40587 [uncultured Pleomorphomonas sp.]
MASGFRKIRRDNKRLERRRRIWSKFPGTLFLKLARKFARVRERSCHAVTAERIASHGPIDCHPRAGEDLGTRRW